MLLELTRVYDTPVFTLRAYNPQLKRVCGASYHAKTQTWRFPAFRPIHARVLSDLHKLVPEITYSDEVKAHLATETSQLTLPQEFSYVTPPYQHQIDGLTHLYNNLRAGLFYSPGLGKCKITVDLQRLTGQPMLILCPRIMLGTWKEEFKKHGGIEDVIVIDGSSKKVKMKRVAEAAARTPAATIVTYGIATLYPEDLLKIGYTCIVADESHQMKTPFAKRTKAATQLALRASRRVLLSGTPSLGSPFDLYGQLRFLGPYFCPEDWWAFKSMFGIFSKGDAKFVVGYKNLDQMNERVNYVCLRKTKEECLDLPDQVIIDSIFDLSHEQAKTYNNMIYNQADAAGIGIRNILELGELNHASGTVTPPHVYVKEEITLLGKVDQIASGFWYQTTRNPGLCSGCPSVFTCTQEEIKPYTPRCKVVTQNPAPVTVEIKDNARLDHLEELLTTILEDDANKVIVWANYRAEMDMIQRVLEHNKWGYVRMHGGLPAAHAQSAMERFNNTGACRVYLGQVSTGIGVTLNAANYTVYYNLPWSLEHYQQSMDRNYRIGQQKKVTVYRLIGRHTLDDAKAAALDQKMDFSRLVTSRSLCATCPEFAKRCAKYNVQLFSDDCIHETEVIKQKAKVRLIPYETKNGTRGT